MEKIFWEILAASALVITMEQFFSAFLKKNCGMEIYRYVDFFLPVSYEHNGFSKGIFSDYDWKCNCFGHYLLVFLSNDICDKYYDDIACDFTKWNIGRRYCNIYLTGSGRFDWKSVSVFGDGENCFLDLHSDFVPAMQRKGGRSTKERIRHFSDHNCKCKHLGTDRKSYNINPCRRRSGKNLVRNYYIHVIVG